MKKVYFLFLVALISISFVAKISAQVNVTFRVDMQDQTVSTNGVHIAGDFPTPLPNWNPSGILLDEPVLGSVYTVTLELNPNSNVEFKYVNGNAWGDDESVPGQCSQNGNRYVEVGENDTTLSIVCYEKCLPCVLPPRNITFQVDMSNEDVSPNGIHVAGTFNNWTPDSTAMDLVGNGIYDVTIELGEGSSHEYKFINGNAWGGDESVPAVCATNNNRTYTVPAMDETIPVVCFGSCDPCTTVVDVNVTFQVDMSEQTVVPEGVHVAGSFQGWNTAGTLMTDNENGIWSYTFVLQSGSYHEYKFLNGIAWGDDETVPGVCAQNNNRFLTVPENDTTLPAVCYSSCVICEPPVFDVAFTVDLATQIVSDSGVYIAGSFQGWDPSSSEMTHLGNKVYEITLPVGEGEVHEYKFINGNDWPGAEFVPGECSNFDGNREFIGPSVNTVFPTVCFNECVECTTRLYEFNLSVLLEGPFNGTDMNTTLFDLDSLPLNQPYNVEPWNYDGGEYLTAEPGSGVVDWVYIQLRETDGDASTATPDKIVDHQAAIVLSDGTIATPDGIPNIYFTGDFTEDLYLLIFHRNHLAVMSASPIENIFGPYSYNFTDALSKAYLDGQKVLGSMYGMIGGDSDANGTVDENDKDINWTPEAGNAGYFGSDLNMDSQVNNPDKNDIWEPNLNLSTQIPQ